MKNETVHIKTISQKEFISTIQNKVNFDFDPDSTLDFNQSDPLSALEKINKVKEKMKTPTPLSDEELARMTAEAVAALEKINKVKEKHSTQPSQKRSAPKLI